MDYFEKLIEDIECHSIEGIRECFENGIHPNDHFRGRPLIYELISEYARGPEFKACVKVFVDYGLHFDDPVLLAVLLDDAAFLDTLLKDKPSALQTKYTLDCAFTPLYNVTLLHICAEYNHVSCAKVLVSHGADVNAKAGIDEEGFGGHTPIFHTVNQNQNKCIDMMNFLLAETADVRLTVTGLIWGKGYEWETFIPAVNPVSYAMMGLLRQFQRTEIQIYEVVSRLLDVGYNIRYSPKNIPNAYLKQK